MSEPSPQEHQAPASDDTSGASSRSMLVRTAVWTIASLALLGYIALGSLNAVWYRYNTFSQRPSRQSEARGIVDTWRNWLDDLPQASGEWVLTAVFVGSVGIVLLCVIWGAWMLLVQAGNPHPRAAGTRRR